MFKNKPYHFLLIEDNDGDYYLISEYLKEKLPEHSLTRYSKFSALKENELSAEYDAILLDLNLPDNKGNELVNTVCHLFTEIPIIVLTGEVFEEFALDAISLGASDYLIKDNLNPDILYKSILYSVERKANLQLLKKSQQLYFDLFEFNPQPTWVYDLETLQFLDVNEKAINHYGYSKEEFLNMTIKDIRPKEQIPNMEASLRDFKAEKKLAGNRIFIHLKRNGSEIQVKIDSKIITYMNRRAAIIVATDITEEIEHQKIIEKQNEELKNITWIQSHLVRAPVAKILSIVKETSWEELNKDERNFLFKGLNESATELDGITRQIIGKSEAILQL
jgi:PAS domain S-box-containing protein